MFTSKCSFTKNDPLCMAYHPYHFIGEVLLHPVYIYVYMCVCVCACVCVRVRVRARAVLQTNIKLPNVFLPLTNISIDVSYYILFKNYIIIIEIKK